MEAPCAPFLVCTIKGLQQLTGCIFGKQFSDPQVIKGLAQVQRLLAHRVSQQGSRRRLELAFLADGRHQVPERHAGTHAHHRLMGLPVVHQQTHRRLGTVTNTLHLHLGHLSF